MSSSLIEARRSFGHDVLGPTFAHFMHRLDRSISFFERTHGAKVLFTARAGVRIRYLYETWCEGRGIEASADAETLWISRFLTVKGLWSRQRESCLDLLEAEFAWQPMGKVIEALFSADGGLPAGIDPQDPFLSRPARDLRAAFATGGPLVDLVQDYLAAQSDRFGRYIAETLQERRAALLVDSGWQGTVQRMLHMGLPEYAWYGAYYGKSFMPGSDRSVAHRMLGLVFEADNFDVKRPETAVIAHRHLIEALLEPRGPSIETLADGAGRVMAPQSAVFADPSPSGAEDAMYSGVAAYLRGPAAVAGPAAVRGAFTRASAELARMLLYPTALEAEILGSQDRSADFGRSLRVPVILPPRPRKDDDTAEKRIGDALWPPGQIALEYPDELAVHRQQQEAGIKLSPARLLQAALERAPEAAPELAPDAKARAAVIMRTMDRPLFLRRALRSVARQTMTDYELVVVCDGGDAQRAAMEIERSVLDQRKVRLVDNVQNRGMEAASNIAIRHSDSDYVVIHDDDDSWDPAFLERTVRFLDEAPSWKFGGVITHCWYISEEVTPEGVIERARQPYNDWVTSVQLMEMSCNNFFAPIAFMFRRSLYEQIGGFDERFPVLGDWDFNLRTLAVSDIGVLPEKLANYHHRDTGNVGLYANSVVGMRAKHAEFNPLLRHKYLREQSKGSAAGLGAILPLAHALEDLRNSARATEVTVRSLAQNERDRSESVEHFTRLADDRWVRLAAQEQQLAAMQERLRAAEQIDGRKLSAEHACVESSQLLLRESQERVQVLERALAIHREEADALRSALDSALIDTKRLEVRVGVLEGIKGILSDMVESLKDDLWILRCGASTSVAPPATEATRSVQPASLAPDLAERIARARNGQKPSVLSAKGQ